MRGIQRRAHFQARGTGLQSGEIGARAVGRLARLREFLGARAFLQFAQVRLGFAQVGFRGLGDRDLAVGFGFAHQAARHQLQQPVAFAHRVVALRLRGVAPRDGRADRRGTRAIGEFLHAGLGLGELRAGRVEFRRPKWR